MMKYLWYSGCYGLLLLASGMLAGCSGGDDVDVPVDNAEDVSALRNLGAKLDFNEAGRVKRVVFSAPRAEDAALMPNGEAASPLGVSDDDLKHLAGLPGLSVLELWSPRITDAGLVHLAKLKNLTSLDLMQTRITDNGLDHLSGLERLKTLNLYGTLVSDDGIEKLASLSHLETLDLRQTKVTEQGCERLRRKMPKTKIWRR